MRPWTALSFDGNANLYQGVALAASPEAKNRGAMVAFNDRIVPGCEHRHYPFLPIAADFPQLDWVTKTVRFPAYA